MSQRPILCRRGRSGPFRALQIIEKLVGVCATATEEVHFLDSDKHITRELQRDIFWEEEDLRRRQTLARILQDTFDIFL